jgi:hypothetical protein
MEIVLGVLALHAGLIGNRMFVALVVMALFTSLISVAGHSGIDETKHFNSRSTGRSDHDCERLTGKP